MKWIGRTLATLFLAVLLSAGFAYAQYAYQIIRVDVPFEFSIGAKTFPAGHYTLVRTTPGMLTLRDARGHSLLTAITHEVRAGKAPATAKLRFRLEGGRHELAQVFQENDPIGQELLWRQRQAVLAQQTSAPPEKDPSPSARPIGR